MGVPKATVVFDADDSRLSGALARINGKMLALQSRIAKFAAAFIAVRAVAGVVTAGFDRFKQALDVGGQLNDLSANTGIAVADLVVLQQEFANAGKSAEDIGPVFGKMAKTLQGGSADDTIKKLGINLEELKKKTPAEQFRTLGAAINAVQDPSQKAAASMERTARQRLQQTRSANCIAAGAANFRTQRRGPARTFFVGRIWRDRVARLHRTADRPRRLARRRHPHRRRGGETLLPRPRAVNSMSLVSTLRQPLMPARLIWGTSIRRSPSCCGNRTSAA